ncbi:hypothetical protein BY457_1332 [Marinilabilia salmonicolor]|uniref:hypothetical protein n=1 Tax=Marinilabilia salmonicolor TaxID=989 RepID=UPI000D070062|nr:hypothetical protein [Marinilabilia salmonicolor]PRY88191.1 hypothetical protein BY457_1332 [Marinilabilia salmonicolor]
MQMELGELYRQLIPNSSKVIYFFRFNSNAAFTDDYTGYTIIDSTEEFSSKDIKELRGGFVNCIGQNNEIQMIKLTWDANFKDKNDSIGCYVDTFEQVKVRTVEYNSGWAKSNRYKFEKIEENDKTVVFIGLKKEYGKNLPDTVSFEKGGMFVYDNAGLISYIAFSKLMKRKNEKGVVEYGNESFQFYPKDSIFVTDLSDYGYFKRVK